MSLLDVMDHQIKLAEQHAKEFALKHDEDIVEGTRTAYQKTQGAMSVLTGELNQLKTRLGLMESRLDQMEQEWNNYRRDVVNGTRI